MNTQPTTIKKSISLPAEMLEMALCKAREEHRTLSSYIQSLIARDFAKNNSDKENIL